MSPVALVLGGEGTEHRSHCRKFLWTVLSGGLQSAHKHLKLKLKKRKKKSMSYMKCIICSKIQSRTHKGFEEEEENLCLKTGLVRHPHNQGDFLFWRRYGASGQGSIVCCEGWISDSASLVKLLHNYILYIEPPFVSSSACPPCFLQTI